jgi:hypothetical protein
MTGHFRDSTSTHPVTVIPRPRGPQVQHPERLALAAVPPPVPRRPDPVGDAADRAWEQTWAARREAAGARAELAVAQHVNRALGELLGRRDATIAALTAGRDRWRLACGALAVATGTAALVLLARLIGGL